jgi:hypothetical protein
MNVKSRFSSLLQDYEYEYISLERIIIDNARFVSSQMYRAREHGSYVTERETDDPLWHSKHTPSAIRGDVLSQLD